jgi:PAS domain S-box-containing protein
VIHAPLLDAVMKALNQEARASLSAATPQNEGVKRLEELVRVQSVAVLFADNSGKYVGANAAATALTGFSRRELLGHSVWDIIPPSSEREAEVLWRAFIRMGRQEGDITLRRRDGAEIVARYLAGSNLLPGIHVSVMAKI